MGQLNFDPGSLNRRLSARPTRWESLALVFAVALTGAFIWLHSQTQLSPLDFSIYLLAARGEFAHFYYAFWLLPLFWALGGLPIFVAYALWNLLNIFGVFLAARIFGGRVALALFSFSMFSLLYVGQITGLILGGLALLYWGLAHRRFHLAGLGFVLAAAKFHVGLPPAIFLLLAADLSRHEKLRVLLLPGAATALSLLAWPVWPLTLLAKLLDPPLLYEGAGSVSLWRWAGPWTLLLWAPPLLMRLTTIRRLVAILAASALALPYFSYIDLLGLFVLPIGWLPIVLSNFGSLMLFYGWTPVQMLFVVPLSLYLAALMRPGKKGSRRT